jgi:hypothetical protein
VSDDVETISIRQDKKQEKYCPHASIDLQFSIERIKVDKEGYKWSRELEDCRPSVGYLEGFEFV